MNTDKELALLVVRTIKQAQEKYENSLSPNDIPVVATKVNWDYLEQILEDL